MSVHYCTRICRKSALKIGTENGRCICKKKHKAMSGGLAGRRLRNLAVIVIGVIGLLLLVCEAREPIAPLPSSCSPSFASALASAARPAPDPSELWVFLSFCNRQVRIGIMLLNNTNVRIQRLRCFCSQPLAVLPHLPREAGLWLRSIFVRSTRRSS